MDRLRFDGISFGYGDRTLFEGLSLDIKEVPESPASLVRMDAESPPYTS